MNPMICNTHELCACAQTGHEPRLVVLTGGPGAGKTAVLELARKNFCEHIAVLPEAASIIFSGGFWRRESIPARKAAQRAIYYVQRELERIVGGERASAIALCDRGTLDGLAYWPHSDESFFEELGTTREEELLKYAAVIHLRTPAAAGGYNHNNPVRVESASQAAEIDRRIVNAWDGHPKRVIVESTQDFLIKAATAIDLIREQLPNCCKGHRIPELSELILPVPSIHK